MNYTEQYFNALRTDYREYVNFVHNGDWTPTRFHTYLCDYVQEFLEREGKSNSYEILCISTPPQHGKSMTITETLPSWYLGNHPKDRVIEISYNEDFATLFGRRNREKIEQYGKDIFGIEISKDKNTARDFELESNGVKGSMVSRGVLTGVTGRKCNLMIIDDPIKNSTEAMSETIRDRIYSEWVTSFKTRLWVGAKVIIIMTRWHEDDLVGRLLKEEKNIEVLNFPCECDDEATDPLKRKLGDSLCPEPPINKNRDWLKEFKLSFTSVEGSMTWNALYQGRPTALEGNLIKREWWSFYKSDELPEIADWVMSVDAAFKDEKQNDFVAIQVWGKVGANIYLIDAVKKHLNFPDTIMEIRRLRGMYEKCKLTLIEDKANGSAIITMLKKELVGIIPVQPQGSKFSRVNAIVGTIESGNVFLPKDKRFTMDFINECASFPNGKHDDQVDSMSQALIRLVYMRSELAKAEQITNFEKMFPAYFKGKKKGLGKRYVI